MPVLHLAAALLTVLALTPLVRRFALQLNIGDAANESRKIHSGTIPTLGGIAIFAGVAVAFAIGRYASNDFANLIEKGFWAAIVGAALIAAVGALDDVVNLNFKIKFVAQIAIAIFTVVFGERRIAQVPNPFGQSLELVEPFSSALTVVWIVGICNAVNLIDGLDGLAAGVIGIGAATMTLIAWLYGDVGLSIAYAAIAGATLGFLRYNFNPAKIFMGDTGALFIGYVMACLPLFHSPATSDGIVWLQILILGFPIADTLLAPMRRLLSGAHPFKADREHIHHRLMFYLGLSHRHAVLRIYGACVGLCVAALLMVFVAQALGEKSVPFIALIALSAAILGAIGLKRLGYFAALVRKPAAQLLKRRPRRAENALRESDISPKPSYSRELTT